MCIECYVNENRITPLSKRLECLQTHMQYICSNCGRCICINKTLITNLQRWNFPFKTLDIAKMYLRTADFTNKKTCSIYEVIKNNNKILYKIFANNNDVQIYYNKHNCKIIKKVFSVDKYIEYPSTQIRKLTNNEILKYINEE